MTLVYHQNGVLYADRRCIIEDPISKNLRASIGTKIHVNASKTWAVATTGMIPENADAVFGNIHAFLETLHASDELEVNEYGLPYLHTEHRVGLSEALKDVSSFILINRHRVWSSSYVFANSLFQSPDCHRTLYEVSKLPYVAIGSGENLVSGLLTDVGNPLTPKRVFGLISKVDRMVSPTYDEVSAKSLRTMRLNKAIRQYVTELYPLKPLESAQ